MLKTKRAQVNPKQEGAKAETPPGSSYPAVVRKTVFVAKKKKSFCHARKTE